MDMLSQMQQQAERRRQAAEAERAERLKAAETYRAEQRYAAEARRQAAEGPFNVYWKHATSLRNWFIGYGVGIIVLVLRGEGKLVDVAPEISSTVLRLAWLALLIQVGLAFLNKVTHYYLYRQLDGAKVWRYHGWLARICSWFWIDFCADMATGGLLIWATVMLANGSLVAS